MNRNVYTHEHTPLCAPATPRTYAVEQLFGISRTAATPRPLLARHQPPLPTHPNGITLITGFSGTGKSTWLRAAEKQWRQNPTLHITNLWHIPLPKHRALVDCFHLPLHQTLATLARAGLAEAPLFLLPPALLSEGQRFRYRLAKWYARCHRHPHHTHLLIADEFCSMLDRPSAKAVAWQLANFIHNNPNTNAALATAHDDLEEDLHPDITIRMEDES